jgi:protoporphyrinogen oxidase
LYVELADRRSQTPERAFASALPGLTQLGLLKAAHDVEFFRLRTLEHAYVIYDHDYRAALDVIEPFLAEQRIVSSGRYGAWNYSSMEDALIMGRAAARRAQELASPP